MARAIRWDVSKADAALIDQIMIRATSEQPRINAMTLRMDLTAVHRNGNPLRLSELLEADAFNFWHDLNGIQRHINRDTAKLEHCFVPRFSKPKTKRKEA